RRWSTKRWTPTGPCRKSGCPFTPCPSGRGVGMGGGAQLLDQDASPEVVAANQLQRLLGLRNLGPAELDAQQCHVRGQCDGDAGRIRHHWIQCNDGSLFPAVARNRGGVNRESTGDVFGQISRRRQPRRLRSTGRPPAVV